MEMEIKMVKKETKMVRKERMNEMNEVKSATWKRKELAYVLLHGEQTEAKLLFYDICIYIRIRVFIRMYICVKTYFPWRLVQFFCARPF
jgi:hypothetical protein